jgi:hypothetical protein
MSAASDAASFSRTSETTAAFSAFGDVVIVALWLLSNKENMFPVRALGHFNERSLRCD